MRTSSLWLFAGASLLAPIAMATPAPPAVHRFHEDHVLGTSMDFAVVGVDSTQAIRALAAVRAEIARLDGLLSGWHDHSELAALNAGDGPMTVSAELYAVIDGCEAWRARCGGAFTGRLGAIESGWKGAEITGVLPDAAKLSSIAARDRDAPVVLDPTANTIDRAGVRFAVDGLAKGYVIDAALEAARRAAPNASGVLLDIGGDLRCLGTGPDDKGWRIGLADGASPDNRRPASMIQVADKAVATSGGGARDRLINGCAYSHTLSPVSGQPVPPATVTVVAYRATDADALATALSVMPIDEGLALANSLPGVEARIQTPSGKVHTTINWKALTIPADSTSLSSCAPAAKAPAAWPAGFQVEVAYEIPQLNLGRYRPPYVVVWITDQKGDLVRTLFHLGNKPRKFLDSNYIWYKAFSANPNATLDAVTRPSRQPGRYTAVWDGLDDAGKPVGQGRYTINIETSREHGGHSLQTIPLDLGAKPVSGNAAPGEEAGPAEARYGKAQ